MASLPKPYSLKPLTPLFGAIVSNWDWNKDEITPSLIQSLKEDIKQHRLLLFPAQGKIPGEKQVEISAQLGKLHSTFYQHPRSPHSDIFRVSNDQREGCTGVGRTGFHVDGTFLFSPFKYQTMHFQSVSTGGSTWFVPLKEFYEMQEKEVQEEWKKLWMVARSFVHPFVYVHPERGDTSMIFHCGKPFCSAFIRETEGEGEEGKKRREMISADSFLEELDRKLEEATEKIGIKMDWKEGDFALTDNLGLAHYACPDTQLEREEAGLRILHRTTIAGDSIPKNMAGQQSYLLKDFEGDE